jgi:hypothetical protein
LFLLFEVRDGLTFRISGGGSAGKPPMPLPLLPPAALRSALLGKAIFAAWKILAAS